MQYSKIAFLAVVAAPFVAAQSIPACANTLLTSLATATVPGCTTGDVKCYCSNAAFIAGVTTQVQSLCPASDIPAVLSYAQSLCATFGVSLSAPVSVATTSVATTSVSSSPVATTVTLTTTTPSSVVSSTSAAPTTSAPTTSSAVVSPTASKNGTVTTATPTQATGAADKNTWGVAGLLGAGAAAMLLAL